MNQIKPRVRGVLVALFAVSLLMGCAVADNQAVTPSESSVPENPSPSPSETLLTPESACVEFQEKLGRTNDLLNLAETLLFDERRLKKLGRELIEASTAISDIRSSDESLDDVIKRVESGIEKLGKELKRGKGFDSKALDSTVDLSFIISEAKGLCDAY